MKDVEGLRDTRTNFEDLCKYQSKWEPEDYSIKGACYAPREGRVKDLIALCMSGQGVWSSDEEDKDD